MRQDLPAWSHANTWLGEAFLDDNIDIGESPLVGSIACFNDMYPPYGHVAYVTAANADGSFEVTEMGCCSTCWYGVRSHSYAAGSATGFIYGGSAEAIYSCQFAGQASYPEGQDYFEGYPGDLIEGLYVKYDNTGNTTWHSDPGAYPYDYVELKSCDEGGTVMGSLLYDSSWLNTFSPNTFDAGAVHPTQVAWFFFDGRISQSATPGIHEVYFRPNHSAGGLFDNWGGMHFRVNVLSQTTNDENLSFEVDLNSDNVADNWEHRTGFGGVMETHRSGGAPAYSACNAYEGGGSYMARLYNSSSSCWSGIGHANSGPWGQLLLSDGTWYRISFWYRTTNNVDFGCQLAQNNIADTPKDIGAYVTEPLTDGSWHRFISAPFQVSASDISTYPKFAFYLKYDNTGTLDIDDVRILNSGSCHP
jgi:hypothetical protein